MFLEKIPAVFARICFVCGALLLCSNLAHAEGTYQRTKDGKTLVWNSDPEPGDKASWWGDRDREGYATGFGTLTWYKEQQESGPGPGASIKHAVYARYFGDMVRGKFEGPVNAHSRGKTGHAIFAHGRRISAWVAGRAPSRSVATRSVESVKKESVKAQAQNQSLLKYGAEGRQPISPNKAGEGPPRSARSSHDESIRLAKETAKTVAQKRNETIQPESKIETAAARGGGGAAPEPPAEGPPNQPAEQAGATRAATKTARAELDNPLRRLTHPPASLHRDGPLTGKAVSPPAANPSLTKQEVIELADAEARIHGYDPAEYQRSEPQYDPIDETWSLLYEQKPGDGMVDVGKHFSVAVGDKTKNMSVVPGR